MITHPSLDPLSLAPHFLSPLWRQTWGVVCDWLEMFCFFFFCNYLSLCHLNLNADVCSVVVQLLSLLAHFIAFETFHYFMMWITCTGLCPVPAHQVPLCFCWRRDDWEQGNRKSNCGCPTSVCLHMKSAAASYFVHTDTYTQALQRSAVKTKVRLWSQSHKQTHTHIPPHTDTHIPTHRDIWD